MRPLAEGRRESFAHKDLAIALKTNNGLKGAGGIAGKGLRRVFVSVKTIGMMRNRCKKISDFISIEGN